MMFVLPETAMSSTEKEGSVEEAQKYASSESEEVFDEEVGKDLARKIVEKAFPEEPVQTSISYPKGVAIVQRSGVPPATEQQMSHVEEEDLSLDSAKDIKPPYSYATMIGQAILSSPDQKMTLAAIYHWISSKYSFYRFAKTGWQVCSIYDLLLTSRIQSVITSL
jgi:hypothetical protein